MSNENHDPQTGEFSSGGGVGRTIKNVINTALGTLGGAAIGGAIGARYAHSILGYALMNSTRSGANVDRFVAKTAVQWQRFRSPNWADRAKKPTYAEYGRAYEAFDDKQRRRVPAWLSSKMGPSFGQQAREITATGAVVGGVAGLAGTRFTQNSVGIQSLINDVVAALDQGDRPGIKSALDRWKASKYSGDPDIRAQLRQMAKGFGELNDRPDNPA